MWQPLTEALLDMRVVDTGRCSASAVLSTAEQENKIIVQPLMAANPLLAIDRRYMNVMILVTASNQLTINPI